jgi:polar amino acid transport system substrate-binding protein
MTLLRRLLVAALAIAATVTLTGCGSSLNRSEKMTLDALALKTPPAPSSSPSPTVNCSQRTLTASLAPPATPAAIPAGSFMAKIRKRGFLRAGVDQNTLLFAYFNPLTRKIEGFEIDLLQQIANAIFGNKPGDLRLKAITTHERIADVRNNSVDIVADAMTITCYRKTQVDFSTVYYKAGQKILVPANSKVHSIADLGGQKVCATRGSTSLATLLTLTPRPVPYPVDQRTDCLVALQEGLVSAITSDDSILLGFHAQDPKGTKLVGPVFAPDPYGMAIEKTHPDFVQFVNGVLDQMRHDGRWRAIYARWLGKPIPAPPPAKYVG